MKKRFPFRKRHTAEFKVECVRVMREQLAAGLTLQRVSKEMEVGPADAPRARVAAGARGRATAPAAQE